MGKMRMGHDSRNKVPLLRTTQSRQGLESESIASATLTPDFAAMAKEIMEKHADTFKKLAEAEVAEREAKPLATMLPSPVEKHTTHTVVERVETIKTIDKRARTHSVAVRNELHEMVVKKHALLNKAYELQRKKTDELAAKINQLESRKPEEKHTVTKEVVIQEKTSKRMLVICAATIVINVLILLSK